MSSLEHRLNYTFKQPELLKQALTHASCAGANNERFEFLGDRIVGFCVAEWLHETYPQASEGELSKRLSAMVCGETLAQVAQELNLGEELAVSFGEAAQGGGVTKPSLLADALEALIAAIYLDSDMRTTRPIVIRLLEPYQNAVPLVDAKSALQEWLQARSEPLPTYTVIEEIGPAHSKTFMVEVATQNHGSATGTGSNKRSAEQAAAGQIMEKLKND